MPLQRISLPFIPSTIKPGTIGTNSKLLTNDEILAVKNRLQNQRDGYYHRDTFNRIEMTKNIYNVIKSGNSYFAIHSAIIYADDHVKVKLAQDLNTGEWLRLKVYSDKTSNQLMNEKQHLNSIGACVADLTSISRRTQQSKYYLLYKIEQGVDLNEFIQRYTKISVAQRIELTIDILKKVIAIHEQGYILCKLTAADIICSSYTNTVSLCEFGSIRPMNAKREALVPGLVTDMWVAPEVSLQNNLVLLWRAIINTEQGQQTAITKDELLVLAKQLIDKTPHLDKLSTEHKATLLKKFQATSTTQFADKVTAANAPLHCVFNEKTDAYSVGVMLQMLFNYPAGIIPKIITDNKTDDLVHSELKKKRFFELGKQQGAITKFIDGLTTSHPAHRTTLNEALAFFQQYNQKIVFTAPLRMGVIDIGNFNDFVKHAEKPFNYWHTVLMPLFQQIDEFCIVTKDPSYADTVRIQQFFYRLNISIKCHLIYTEKVEDLASIASIASKKLLHDTENLPSNGSNELPTSPSHASDKQPKDEAILRSYIYFDFSQYNSTVDRIYPDYFIKDEMLHLTNGHSVNGHRQPEIVLPVEPPRDVQGNIIIRPERVAEILKESGINTIVIDTKKNLAGYTRQLSECVLTISAEQFRSLKFHLETEIRRLESNVSSDGRYPYTIHGELIELKKIQQIFTRLQSQYGLTYSIAQAQLDKLKQFYPQPASYSMMRLFGGSSVLEKLQHDIQLPEPALLKLG